MYKIAQTSSSSILKESGRGLQNKMPVSYVCLVLDLQSLILFYRTDEAAAAMMIGQWDILGLIGGGLKVKVKLELIE